MNSQFKDYARKLLAFEEDSYASVLLGIVLNAFGTEAFTWDPQTLREELESTFGLKKLHHIPETRIQAAISSLTSDFWLSDIRQFNTICNSFGDGIVPMDVFEPATPDEIAWTLVEFSLMNPPEKNEASVDELMDENVKFYLSKLLENHAIRPMGFFSFLSDYYSVPIIDETDAVLANAGFIETEKEYKNIQNYIEENLKKLTQQVQALGIESKALQIQDAE